MNEMYLQHQACTTAAEGWLGLQALEVNLKTKYSKKNSLVQQTHCYGLIRGLAGANETYILPITSFEKTDGTAVPFFKMALIRVWYSLRSL